jgi:thiol-disulfide isomerase/thioredoxin
LKLVVTFLFMSSIISACSVAEASQPLDAALKAPVQATADLPVLSQPSSDLPKAASPQDFRVVSPSEPPLALPQAVEESLPEAAGGGAAAAQALGAVPTEVPPDSEAIGAGPVQEAPAAATEPRIGFLAPDFSLQALDGSTHRLSDLRGRPVLINYWASWCVPCQTELPILQNLSAEYQSRGLVFLTINAIEQDNLDEVRGNAGALGMSLPVLLDYGEQFWDSYQVLFFPTTFYVDTDGVIRDITLGDSSEEGIRAKIEALLGGG